MKSDSSRNSHVKTTAALKTELDRLQKEEAKLAKRRATLDAKLAKAAEQAENSASSTSSKEKKKPKPKGKRKWKKGLPSVPFPDFPLSPHASGKWQKKINGEIKYFGNWGKRVNGQLERIPGDGWEEALKLYKAQADDLHAGRTPRAKLVNGQIVVEGEGITIADLCNRFLTAKTRQRDSGEITPRTFTEYKSTTDRLISAFGPKRLVTDVKVIDFEKLRAAMAKQFGPVRLGNEIQRVRTVFKYGFEAEIIESQMRFGPQFAKPSKSVMRKHRAKSGSRMYEVSEIRSFFDGKDIQNDDGETVHIAGASPQLRAMILLGINCGFGNSDCGSLPISSVDLSSGWVRFPRPKTGIERRCPLWPETVAALESAISERPEHREKEDADILFLTKYRKRWVRTVNRGSTKEPKFVPIDSIVLEFGKLARSLGINGNRGFYALRHTFRTIADATRDFPAVRLIMGHADHSIDDVYREHIDDSRLSAVTDHVRTWLFGAKKGGAK